MKVEQKHITSKPIIIAVTGGKGGTGKTNIAINLAVALARKSQNVMLFDADLGLANIDVLLGLSPKYNLFDVISGKKSLEEIILTGPSNIQIVPASSGNKKLAEVDIFTLKGLMDSFNTIHKNNRPDYLIIDTSAGISDNVVSLLCASHEIVVVVCNEPASLTDAYALIKLMHNAYHKNHFKILPNKVNSQDDSMAIFNKLTYVTDKYLNVSLRLMEGVKEDKYIRKANLLRQPVVTEFPNALSSLTFKSNASAILNWPSNIVSDGNIELFREQACS